MKPRRFSGVLLRVRVQRGPNPSRSRHQAETETSGHNQGGRGEQGHNRSGRTEAVLGWAMITGAQPFR